MALLADNGADRAEQLVVLTERLTHLIGEETRAIEARQPPLAGEAAEEKNRLANAYRLELARLKQEPSLLSGAPPALLAQLKKQTGALQTALATHEIQLNAVKVVTEGLCEAMAEEIVRQRGCAVGYGAGGALDAPSGPTPALLDKSA